MEGRTACGGVCSFCLHLEQASKNGKKTRTCGHKICFQCIQDQWLSSRCNDSEAMECALCRQMSASTEETVKAKQNVHSKSNGLDSTTRDDASLTYGKDIIIHHTTPGNSHKEHETKRITPRSPISISDISSGTQMCKNDITTFTHLEDKLSDHKLSSKDKLIRRKKEKSKGEVQTKFQEDDHQQRKAKHCEVAQNVEKKNGSLNRNLHDEMKSFQPLTASNDAHITHISNRDNVVGRRYIRQRNISKSCSDLFQQTVNDQKEQVREFESCLGIIQDSTRVDNPVSQHEVKTHHDTEWNSLSQYFELPLFKDPKTPKESPLCSSGLGECSPSSSNSPSLQYGSPSEDFWLDAFNNDTSFTGFQISESDCFLKNTDEETLEKSSKTKTYGQAATMLTEDKCEKRKVEADISFTRKPTLPDEIYLEDNVVPPSVTKSRFDSDQEVDGDVSLYISCRESPSHRLKAVNDNLSNHNESNRNVQSKDISVDIKETCERHLQHILSTIRDTSLMKRRQAEFIPDERDIKDDPECSNLEICKDIFQMSLTCSLLAHEAVEKVGLLLRRENLSEISAYQMLANIMSILLQQANVACTVSCQIIEDIYKRETRTRPSSKSTSDTGFISYDDTAYDVTIQERPPSLTRTSGIITTIAADITGTIHTSSKIAATKECQCKIAATKECQCKIAATKECQCTDSTGKDKQEVIPLTRKISTCTSTGTTLSATQSATQQNVKKTVDQVSQTENVYSVEHNADLSYSQKSKDSSSTKRMTFTLDKNLDAHCKQQTNCKDTTETPPVRVNLKNRKDQSLFEGDPFKRGSDVRTEVSSHCVHTAKTNEIIYVKENDSMIENDLKPNSIGKQSQTKYLLRKDEIHSQFKAVLDELQSSFKKAKTFQISEIGICENVSVKDNFRMKQPVVVIKRLSTAEHTKRIPIANSEVKQTQKNSGVDGATSLEDRKLVTTNNEVNDHVSQATSFDDTNLVMESNDVIYDCESQHTTGTDENEKVAFNDVQENTTYKHNNRSREHTDAGPVKLYSARDIIRNPILVKKIVDKLRETFSPKSKFLKPVNHEGTQVSEFDLIPFDNVRKAKCKNYPSTKNMRSVKRNLKSSYSTENLTSITISQSPAKFRKLNDGSTPEINKRSRCSRYINSREKDYKNSKTCGTKPATTISDCGTNKGSRFHRLRSASKEYDPKHSITVSNQNIQSFTTSSGTLFKIVSRHFPDRMINRGNTNAICQITFTSKKNSRDVYIQTDLPGGHHKVSSSAQDNHQREVGNKKLRSQAQQKAKTSFTDSKFKNARFLRYNNYDSKKLGNNLDNPGKIFTETQKSKSKVYEANTRRTKEDKDGGQWKIKTKTPEVKEKNDVYSARHASSSEEDNVPLAYLPEDFKHRLFYDSTKTDDLPHLVYPSKRRLRRTRKRCDRQNIKDFPEYTCVKGTPITKTASASECENRETGKTEVKYNKRSPRRRHRFVDYSSSDEYIPPARKRGIQYTKDCLKILDKVYNHDTSDLFRHEVKSKDIPDYYVTVKRGMCFDLIAYKLRNNIYEDLSDFVADIHLVFNNCRLYYKDVPKFCKAADVVEQIFDNMFHATFSSITSAR